MPDIPVVVNSRFLTQPTTGVQRFAENISLELKRLLPDAVFVSPHDILNEATASRLDAHIIGLRRGHAWEQIDLPNFLKNNGRALLLNLANTGPLFYGNQIATLFDIAFVRYPQNFSLPFRAFYKFMAPRLARDSRALITSSEFSKREICTQFRIEPKHVHLVPCAVDQSFSPQPLLSPGKPYLLAVSSPNLYKNFSRVICAYTRWKQRNSIDLRIVGSAAGSFAQQNYGTIPNGVKFIGRVDDPQLISLYSHAVGFVFPSLYEGFGIPPLEAQACGCPVIASTAASIPEVLGDSAIYFDPLDENDMVRAMDALISLSPHARLDLIACGHANVSRFSWENSARIVAGIIRDLSEPRLPDNNYYN